MLNDDALDDPQNGLQIVFLDNDSAGNDPLIRSVQARMTEDGLWKRGCEGYSCQLSQ